MKGAIIGDIIGSTYEFMGLKDKNVPLKTKVADFTDDTICTIATMDWLMNLGDNTFYKDYLVKWCKRYPNPKGGYGGMFKEWLNSEYHQPYWSYGNGSAMRVSPIALWTKRDVGEGRFLAIDSAKVTHDHPEGLKGAQAAVTAIILAEQKFPKDYIRKQIADLFHYDMDFKLKDVIPNYRFDESCQGTVPYAITAFLEARSYEETIRNCLSLGGDADTLCAIAGGIAEAYYGIPKSLENWAFKKLPEEFKIIINQFYEKVK